MNQVPMMQESRAPLLHGWVGSIALHSLLLLSLLPLFHRPTVTVPNESFHWDVSLVQSIPPVERSDQNIETPKSTITRQSARTAVAPRAHQSTHHVRSFSEHVASVEPQAKATVAQKTEPTLPPTDTLETGSPATSTSEEPTPNLTQADVPPLQQAEPPIDTATQDPSSQETVTAPAVQEQKSPGEAAESSPLNSPLSETTAAPPTRPDYSWLQQAIFRRLEELKRSSRPSFSQFEPLKVMVKAVVSRDGTLLDSAVVTSSGFARIDQEAMALVQRAFPMQFDRAVDRQQIVMRIPIIYTRE